MFMIKNLTKFYITLLCKSNILKNFGEGKKFGIPEYIIAYVEYKANYIRLCAWAKIKF